MFTDLYHGCWIWRWSCYWSRFPYHHWVCMQMIVLYKCSFIYIDCYILCIQSLHCQSCDWQTDPSYRQHLLLSFWICSWHPSHCWNCGLSLGVLIVSIPRILSRICNVLIMYDVWYNIFYSLEQGEPPLVETAANVFRQLCYDYRDTLTAGIIVAGWDKRHGGQVINWWCLTLLFILLGKT
jgi:hypothetical protein